MSYVGVVGLMGGEARGYSWAPFEPGHEQSVKHGATSPRKVQPLADQLAADLVESAPWAAKATHAATVRSWAWVEAQAILLRSYVDEHGILDGDGEPRAAAKYLDRIEARASNLRAELGLSPLSLAKLLAAVASVAAAAGDEDSLEALRREGQAIVAARSTLAIAEPRAIGAPDDTSTEGDDDGEQHDDDD